MNTNMPETKSRTRLNVISLVISAITSLIGASVIVSGRGAGMEALATLLPLIVFGGGGLVVAFLCGIAALVRGAQPYILTILALIVPPVAGYLAPALGR